MSRRDFPSGRLDQYIVRFPDGLRDRIKAAAKVNRRSMNAEIVRTLEINYPDVSFGVAATGAKFGDQTPAAASINQGCEGASA